MKKYNTKRTVKEDHFSIKNNPLSFHESEVDSIRHINMSAI